MAYGNLKADNLIYADSTTGVDTVIPLEHVAGKAPLANPAFTGSLTIDRATTGEDIAKFKSDGSCELYHNDVLRLSTTNVAVDVSGILTVSGNANFGPTSNTQLTSSTLDGGVSYHTMLENSSTGDLYLRGTEFYLQDNTTGNANQSWIHCLPSAGVKLYYDGDPKLETTTDGVTVTGKVVTTGIDNSNQFNIKPGGEFFKFENSSAWKLTYDKTAGYTGGGVSWTYGIDVDKSYVKLYGGEAGSTKDATVVLQTKTTGVDITGDLDVSANITAVDATFTGNLIVNGTTTEINSTTLTVDDKNIELATVADVSGQTATIVAGQSTVTVTSTAGYLVDATVTKTGSEAGEFNAAGVTIASIDSATQFTVSAAHATDGAITFNVENQTDLTANGGGITLKGTTDKTILWTDATDSWDFNQSIRDPKGDLRQIPQEDTRANLAADHVLVSDNAGEHLLFQPAADYVAGSAGTKVTVNNNVFSAGDAITIVNHSAYTLFIEKGTASIYNTADGTDASRTLAARGMATLLFVTASTCYISGAGLS